MAQTNVKVWEQVWLGRPNDWQLSLQWCTYVYPDEEPQDGYRFIWRRPDGTLQAARGQARLPSIKAITKLISLAEAAGWADRMARDASGFS